GAGRAAAGGARAHGSALRPQRLLPRPAARERRPPGGRGAAGFAEVAGRAAARQNGPPVPSPTLDRAGRPTREREELPWKVRSSTRATDGAVRSAGSPAP